MEPLRYFDSMELLEPKCPNCNVKIDWGGNTAYKDKLKASVCLCCGEVL